MIESCGVTPTCRKWSEEPILGFHYRAVSLVAVGVGHEIGLAI